MVSPLERAQEAHRASFALVTATLSDPEHVDLGHIIRAFLADAARPSQKLLDITEALVWHTASALLSSAGDDRDAALQLVRDAALAKEST